MSIGTGIMSVSFELSSSPAGTGEDGRRLSCIEIALNAGLTSWEQTELVRDRTVPESVMIDSLGLAPVLFFHFREKEGNLVPNRLATADPGESPALRFLDEELAENSTSVAALSSKL